MALLRVKDLVKRFGETPAVNKISFDIAEGHCVALLGPNGAGKTTTLQMLAGLLPPTDGSIAFPGIPAKDLRQHIGYLPQYPAFYNWMKGREFLEYVGKLAFVQSGQLKERANVLLELVGLSAAGNRKIGGYSGGMRQRLGIAQALIHKPKLLMLDEPVSALDPIGRREVLDMMRQIRKETTILFSTHVLHDAEEICDDVLIMNRGTIAAAGSLQEIRETSRQPIVTIESDAEEPLRKWAAAIGGQPYVEEVELNGRTARVYVNDIREANRRLLEQLVAGSVPVVKFEVAQASLEDLFMKAVRA
ncbi:ATP-binding cassette domain-containing protein [Paenibacillus sp. MBLB4367]|uniref:ABC transporter ATP-binding protein n=1 Tax=Paenibacillus sp. MBLB4367 TaxID=3384767 RepID=UPI003907F7CE